jgi:hypothetical protein
LPSPLRNLANYFPVLLPHVSLPSSSPAPTGSEASYSSGPHPGRRRRLASRIWWPLAGARPPPARSCCSCCFRLRSPSLLPGCAVVRTRTDRRCSRSRTPSLP